MRYAIISDIHANLEALETVLRDIGARECDQIVCLGDFVGYGPDPNACVERASPLLNGRAVAGNHDLAAVGGVDISFFNVYAQQAIIWTQQALQPSVRAFLTALPRSWKSSDGYSFLAVHGSPRDPVEEYVLDGATAHQNFREGDFTLCFIGHSHVPHVFRERNDQVESESFPQDGVVRLDPEWRYLINVGSVGQPRDGDPRAAYGIFDADRREVALIRLEYPFEQTQEKMRAHGLPEVLADRLAYGR